MDGAPPIRRPWMLIAAALVLLSMLAYVLVGAYLPSRQRMAGLEIELKDLYQKGAEQALVRFAGADRNPQVPREAERLAVPHEDPRPVESVADRVRARADLDE